MPIASYNSATKMRGPGENCARYRYDSETKRLLTNHANVGRTEGRDDSGEHETRKGDVLFR